MLKKKPKSQTLHLLHRLFWFLLAFTLLNFYFSPSPFPDEKQIEEFSWIKQSLINETILPGPTKNWEFFVITTIVDVNNNAIYIISISNEVFNNPDKRPRVWLEETAPKSWNPKNLLKAPWEGTYDFEASHTSCSNSTWLGKQHRVDLCLNRIQDSPLKCNQEMFALGSDGNCLCVIPEGCEKYTHRFVTTYRIRKKKMKKWECYLPEFDIATDVRWAPTQANLDSHCNDVMNVAICRFDNNFNDMLFLHTKVILQLRHMDQEPIFQTEVVPSLASSGRFKPSKLYDKTANMNRNSFPQISMCIHMFGDAAFYWVIEFIIHHLNIGVDHIFIGFYELSTSKNYQTLAILIDYFIKHGFVSLMTLKIPHIDWQYMGYQEYLYGECLYFSKIRGDFLMMSDIDEFLVPHNREPIVVTLQSYLQRNDIVLEELCSFTFQSFNLPGDYSSFNPKQGFISDRFPVRDVETTEMFIKTMSYSPNIFNQGAHIPAACTISGIQNQVKPNVTAGAILLPPELISMHHFFQAINIRREVSMVATIPHEYGLLWSMEAKEAFCWLFDFWKLSKTEYESITGTEYNCHDISAKQPTWHHRSDT